MEMTWFDLVWATVKIGSAVAFGFFALCGLAAVVAVVCGLLMGVADGLRQAMEKRR